jgi:hypothetical protein
MNVRKDLLIRKILARQKNMLIGALLIAHKTGFHINSLVASDIKINDSLSEIPDISSITTALDLALTAINTKKETAMFELDSIKEEINLLKALGLGEINTATIDAKSEISLEKNNAISVINQLASDVSNEMNNLNTGIKIELLSKIDYLFQMFYRSSSIAIMEEYPL